MRMQILFAVSDQLRRAINFHHGRPGKASRQEVKSWLWQHGHSKDDELLAALYAAEQEVTDTPTQAPKPKQPT